MSPKQFEKSFLPDELAAETTQQKMLAAPSLLLKKPLVQTGYTGGKRFYEPSQRTLPLVPRPLILGLAEREA